MPSKIPLRVGTDKNKEPKSYAPQIPDQTVGIRWQMIHASQANFIPHPLPLFEEVVQPLPFLILGLSWWEKCMPDASLEFNSQTNINLFGVVGAMPSLALCHLSSLGWSHWVVLPQVWCCCWDGWAVKSHLTNVDASLSLHTKIGIQQFMKNWPHFSNIL